MKKLHLDLDGLEVESFHPTDSGAARRGTVRGFETVGVPLSDWFGGNPCSGDSVCQCNTTFTAQLPQCGGDTEICP